MVAPAARGRLRRGDAGRRSALRAAARVRPRAGPALDQLLARLAPVDIVLLEGFRDARVPTIEVLLGDGDRPPRWPEDPTIVALVCDRRIASALPQFAPTTPRAWPLSSAAASG
ncbi:MAG: molybdopterin-guanine dinucleotide biosynthesis protein MobB [Betaproteobacteria bacterium]|nr:molybdopterin-guanine dinucleotide biosynthesis protein MobB [Betaproteobacteria bacterium]